ncbi:MAG: hypothetical protein V3W44_08500 [Dehalococcoidales bacterium]
MYDLKIRGITQRQIARELGVGSPLVCKVIWGIIRTRKIQKKIAEIIGYNPFPAAD